MRLKSLSNRIALVIISSLIASSFLTGCEYEDNLSKARKLVEERSGIGSEVENGSVQDKNLADAGSAGSASKIAVFDTDGNELDISESVIEMMENEDGDTATLSASDLVSANSDLFDTVDLEYAYSMLDDTEKEIYKEIFSVLINLEEDAELSTTDTDVIDHAFKAVLVDHPEIFYVKGYSINKYMLGTELKKITLTGAYTMDDKSVKAKQKEVEAYVERALSGIDDNASDYEKIKYVYEYLIKNNSYDMNAENNQNILSVCENGRTVCQGYAKMNQLLLGRLGVFATIVNGVAVNSSFKEEDGTIHNMEGSDWGSHVWNIVKADGDYYNVDVTWGDASFRLSNETGDYVTAPEISYDYLCVPDAMLLDTHSPQPVVKMPPCTGMQDNYYVREGLYVKDIDKGMLTKAFKNAYDRGESSISLKAADQKTYDSLKHYFVDEEAIFDYIVSTSVKYVEYPQRLTITIYL